MSDAPENPHAAFAFVSEGGRIVGVGEKRGDDFVGICLARLDRPITLMAWTTALCMYDTPIKASEAITHLQGGTTMFLVVPLPDPTIVPAFMGGVVGDA